eukprot:11726257-Ditylum_brightwellii.AAC.1
MKKAVKCKPVATAEEQFDLMEFKNVETTCISKRLGRTDEPAKVICEVTYKVCLQELKKH